MTIDGLSFIYTSVNWIATNISYVLMKILTQFGKGAASSELVLSSLLDSVLLQLNDGYLHQLGKEHIELLSGWQAKDANNN